MFCCKFNKFSFKIKVVILLSKSKQLFLGITLLMLLCCEFCVVTNHAFFGVVKFRPKISLCEKMTFKMSVGWFGMNKKKE